MRGVCESILWSEAVVGDARGAVVRAADEAEAVGQQREGEHIICVVVEGAQDGAVVDVEELDGVVARAGERVLVVGRRCSASSAAIRSAFSHQSRALGRYTCGAAMFSSSGCLKSCGGTAPPCDRPREMSRAVSSASDGCTSAGCESSSKLLQRASARPSSSPQRSASEPAKAQSWRAVEVHASGIVLIVAKEERRGVNVNVA